MTDDEPVTILKYNPAIPGQCREMFCISEPHDDSIHCDYTGTTWDSATGDIISGHDGE